MGNIAQEVLNTVLGFPCGKQWYKGNFNCICNSMGGTVGVKFMINHTSIISKVTVNFKR